MYSQFCDHYSLWNKKTQGYMPTVYKAREKLFIDYAGKKLHIIDPQTGEIKAVEVFMGTLGAEPRYLCRSLFYTADSGFSK